VAAAATWLGADTEVEENMMATIEGDNRILSEKMSGIVSTTGHVDNQNEAAVTTADTLWDPPLQQTLGPSPQFARDTTTFHLFGFLEVFVL